MRHGTTARFTCLPIALGSLALFSCCSKPGPQSGSQGSPKAPETREAAERQPGELPGRKPDEVLVVIHADDLGMTEGMTDASVGALVDGTVSSASIWMVGNDADRALAIFRERPELDVGVHLTLTGGDRAVLARDEAPSLYNEKGRMWDTMEEVCAHVTVEDAKKEWDAQIRKALDAGIEVSHLDGHMGCYFGKPDFFRAAFGLAKKYRIPLIAPYIPAFAEKKDRDLFPVTEYTGIYALAGKETLENRKDAYGAMFSSFTPGVHYLYTHLAYRSGDPAKMTGDIPLRANELEFWTRYGREMLSGAGYTVIGTKEMKTAFQAALER